MGKRKLSMAKRLVSKKPKVAEKLETVFTCPFCNHTNSVGCTINKKLWVANVCCSMCLASFSTIANSLTEPIDVYSEWIDECVKVNYGVEVVGF